MSDNEGVGAKRTFSKVGTPPDQETPEIDRHELGKPEPEKSSGDDRRDIITEEMAKAAEEYQYVDTKWLAQFFEGDDSPVLFAKGEAATKINSGAFDLLSKWLGVRTDAIAVRVADLDRSKPAEVCVLETRKTLSEALDLPASYWFQGAVAYSAVPSRSSISAARVLDANAKVGDLELEKNETIVFENPENWAVGRTGLGNMGNTCYMNSSLQCLLHIPELASYFLTSDFKKDLNRENPIGCGGEVAEAFAGLAKQAYTERGTSLRPVQFRNAIGKFNSSFANRMQQDSQEFTTFLLDSLHEDLNRVLQKPATTEPELGDDEKPTEEVVERLARESWDTHKMRNDSKIMDLFTGMYKSTLVCPVCNKISVRFDPFFDLTLPLPSSEHWIHEVTYVPLEAERAPVKLEVALSPLASMAALKQQVASLVGTAPERLIAGDLFQKKFYRIFKDGDTVAEAIDPSDIIALYDIGPRQDLNSDTLAASPADQSATAVYILSSSYQGQPFFVSLADSASADEVKSQVRQKIEQFIGASPEFSIKVYDGSIDELSYTVDQRRTWPLEELGGIQDTEQKLGNDLASEHPQTPPSDTDEPFETISMPVARDASAQALNNLTSLNSPVQSPGSSSISPLSDAGSPPAVHGLVRLESEDGVGELEHSIKHNNSVILVEFADVGAEERPAVAYESLENPAAVEAKRVVEAHRTTTLEDCLDQFSQPEILGENDVWYCPRCKDFRQAQKRIELWRVPEVFMIHLKRFSGSVNKKITDLVTFPLKDFDVSKHLSASAQKDNDELVYDLIAVDNHFGGMGGGHYTAFVYDPFKQEWLNFNDSFVTPTEAESVVSPAAYLLFYKRRNASTTVVESLKETVASLREAALAPPPVPSPPLPSPPSSDVFVGEGRRLGSGSSGENAKLPWAT